MDKVVCPLCQRLISLNRDGTLRRHYAGPSGDEFDLKTDGICSASNSLPLTR